jgi:hypothetical protein
MVGGNPKEEGKNAEKLLYNGPKPNAALTPSKQKIWRPLETGQTTGIWVGGSQPPNGQNLSIPQ